METINDDLGAQPLPQDTAQPSEAQAPQPEVTTDEKQPLPKRSASATVQQDAEIFQPLDKDWNNDGVILPLAADTFERTQEAITKLPNVRIDDTEGGREWADLLRSSQFTIQYKGVFNRTVERPDAAFRQSVPSERGALGFAAPSFRDTENTKISGEKAVLRVRALLNLGSIVWVPLWHSGFWLALKAPSDADLLELNRRLSDDKVSLGRQTYGLSFANNSVFFAGTIMDFALSFYYDSSLKDSSINNIRANISALDIPLIAWGLACVTWPRGFQYARPILDGDNYKTVKEKINIGKLLWTDTSALTTWQIAHMAHRSGNTMTNEQLERYRGEFVRGKGRTIALTPDLSMTLRVPMLDQYLASGQKWVNNIVAMVDKAFGLPPDNETRDRYIRDQGRASNMRQYAHWVESLQVGNNNLIDDEETLDQTIDVLSADDDIRKAYFAGVQDFMEDATVSLIAVPAATEDENSELPRFPHLLPLDALSTFFILLVQKIDQIQSRV